jgi:uncharacterized membrane protein YebE (DUF533 family)
MPRLTIRVEACTEILALLIVVAWADGKLEDNEKAGIRAAASVLNLNKELRARLDAMLEAPLPLDQVLINVLNPRDRAFGYVAAVWLSGVDEDVDPKEQDLLLKMRELLGIDDARGEELSSIARELGKPKAGDAWADDLVTLFKAIPPRLEPSDSADDLEIAFE